MVQAHSVWDSETWPFQPSPQWQTEAVEQRLVGASTVTPSAAVLAAATSPDAPSGPGSGAVSRPLTLSAGTCLFFTADERDMATVSGGRRPSRRADGCHERAAPRSRRRACQRHQRHSGATLGHSVTRAQHSGSAGVTPGTAGRAVSHRRGALGAHSRRVRARVRPAAAAVSAPAACRRCAGRRGWVCVAPPPSADSHGAPQLRDSGCRQRHASHARHVTGRAGAAQAGHGRRQTAVSEAGGSPGHVRCGATGPQRSTQPGSHFTLQRYMPVVLTSKQWWKYNSGYYIEGGPQHVNVIL